MWLLYKSSREAHQRCCDDNRDELNGVAKYDDLRKCINNAPEANNTEKYGVD